MNKKADCNASVVQAQEQKEEVFQCPLRKVILLAGPTASGKTALSLVLAKYLGGEIISADSMQMYRHMDIGTAKVSKKIQQEIPHHLIDIRHIQQPFNVVDFFYEATQCIEAVLSRHRVPIVVGGTGFYFRALIYGPPKGPPAVLPLRKQITDYIETHGIEEAYATIQTKDPLYSQQISKHDRQKIIRALEIMTLTGNKVSDFAWHRESPRDTCVWCPWFLVRPMPTIYERINQRCDQMLADGFLQEVEYLLREGIMHNVSAAHAIGYRQAIAFLQGPQQPSDFVTFVQEFKRASRRYAKRQMTWFRGEPIFHWLDMEAYSEAQVVQRIVEDFSSRG